MKTFIFKSCASLTLLTFISVSAADDFIIKPNAKNTVSGSKNTLKEKLGDSTKRAINFTTELTSLIGKIKISFADNVSKKCKMCQLSKMQKNDGHIQVQLSSIQSSFTDLVEKLIDNKGFFKKASRSDLGNLVTEMNMICSSLQMQIQKFDQLCKSVEAVDKSKELTMPTQICAQFELSAKEITEVQEKVKGLKCLKKS